MRNAIMPRYRVEPHIATLALDLDRSRLNALADELDDEAVLDRMLHAPQTDQGLPVRDTNR